MKTDWKLQSRLYIKNRSVDECIIFVNILEILLIPKVFISLGGRVAITPDCKSGALRGCVGSSPTPGTTYVEVAQLEEAHGLEP